MQGLHGNCLAGDLLTVAVRNPLAAKGVSSFCRSRGPLPLKQNRTGASFNNMERFVMGWKTSSVRVGLPKNADEHAHERGLAWVPACGVMQYNLSSIMQCHTFISHAKFQIVGFREPKQDVDIQDLTGHPTAPCQPGTLRILILGPENLTLSHE